MSAGWSCQHTCAETDEKASTTHVIGRPGNTSSWVPWDSMAFLHVELPVACHTSDNKRVKYNAYVVGYCTLWPRLIYIN